MKEDFYGRLKTTFCLTAVNGTLFVGQIFFRGLKITKHSHYNLNNYTNFKLLPNFTFFLGLSKD